MLDQLAAPGFGVWRRPRWRQGQALAGGLRPALTPAPGDTDKAAAGSRPGMQEQRTGECFGRGVGWGLGWAVEGFWPAFSLFCWENGLSSNTDSNRIGVWNSGNQQSAPSAAGWMGPRQIDDVFAELLDTVETGGLDQLTPERKWCCGNGSKPSGTGCPSWITI